MPLYHTLSDLCKNVMQIASNLKFEQNMGHHHVNYGNMGYSKFDGGVLSQKKKKIPQK